MMKSSPYTNLRENMEDKDAVAGEQPAGEQPTGEQPAGEQPAGDQSAGDQSAGEQSVAEQPTGDEPVVDEVATDEPVTDSVEEETETKESSDADFMKDKILTTNNLYMLVFFIIVYVVAYFILGMFTNTGSSGRLTTFSYIIDLLLSIIIITTFLIFYFSLDEEKQGVFVKERWSELKDYIKDDYAGIYQTIYILILYTVVYAFRIPMNGMSKPVTIYFLETVGWLILLFILTFMFFKYAFNVSIFDDFEKLFDLQSKTSDPDETPPSDIATAVGPLSDVPAESAVQEPLKEVFNFANNKYNYDDAQAICKAYGAELATYDQIENSYNNGSEWCNYGWSADQMAYFPTQKETWKKLQSDDKKKNACGRPGVNGGYMANPKIKFGVNCYGVKPEAKQCNLDKLNKSGPHIPMTDQEKAVAAKVAYWKENGDKKLNINSFNYNKWSAGS